jgi:hypothetical protein
MAEVACTHLLGDNEKLFRPASFLVPSNSRELKPGLLSCSHTPRKSTVSLARSQFSISAPCFSKLRTLSESEM